MCEAIKKIENKSCEKYRQNLKSMIRHETISVLGQKDLSKFRKFHALLAELFPSLFEASEVEDFDGSLLLRWCGKAGTPHGETGLPILLMSHHDVVEANGDWIHPPFSGEISDGKMWGRGTLDTKTNLWAMLQAADDLASGGYVPSRDIYFLSACNEEVSGEGARAIASELKRRAIEFEMIMDEGHGVVMESGEAYVGIGEKGVTELEFIARSEGGHASKPPKNSPLVRLGRFMAAVEDNLDEIFPQKPHEGTNEIQQTSIAFTVAAAAESRNVIPTRASVIVSMRSSHHQTVDGSISAISAFAEGYGVETEILFHGMTSAITDVKSKEYERLTKLIENHFPGAKAKPQISCGATDACYMSELSSCTLRFSPLIVTEEQMAAVHADNENISLAALAPAVEFYKKVMRNEF